MQNHILLHIPHASTTIPQEYKSDYLKDIAAENAIMADLFTDELFDIGMDSIVFPVSRLLCDVEGFRDDSMESMSSIGMGAIYTTCHDLTPLRKITPARAERILKTWYDPHHARLTEMAGARLQAFNRCLIIDCHSFPPAPLPYERDTTAYRPDICIGTDSFHTPIKLGKHIADNFRSLGYSTAFNSPFSGAIVPFSYYKTEPRVHSVMIEINRGLYLTNDGQKNNSFDSLKSDIRKVLMSLVSSEF